MRMSPLLRGSETVSGVDGRRIRDVNETGANPVAGRSRSSLRDVPAEQAIRAKRDTFMELFP